MFFKISLLLMALPYVLGGPAGSSIDSFTINGSGCGPGTTNSTINADSVSVTIGNFKAAVGGGASIIDSRKNCQAVIAVTAPDGWQFTPSAVIFKGSVRLDGTSSSTRTTSYYFQSQLPTGSAQTVETGPLLANGTTTTDSLTNGPASACGGQSIISINAAIRLGSTSGGVGASTLTSMQFGNFVWSECSVDT